MFDDLAIIIHTCDKYQFVWNGWYDTFKRHWDFNLDIDIYFANEEIDVSFENVKQLKTGKGEWSDRLIKVFKSIPHKHVLYWQEDMWMQDNLYNFRVYYDDFIKHNMDYLMFMCEQDVIKNRPTYTGLLNNNYLKVDIDNAMWVIFHQPAIWKKDFFLKYLQHNENPWINEVEATKQARIDNKNKEINIYNVNNLHRWYMPVVTKGEFKKGLKDIFKNDI